jgi:hypothetical protein
VAHGFREELRHGSTLSPTIPSHGPVMEGVPAGTFSRDFPSASCTCYEGARSKSSPLPTVDTGRVTGGREPDQPSNFRMQRSALRAAADPAR